MSLNIKNPRVHDLAREAARRTGTSQTAAIETALTRYLESLDRPAEDEGRKARIDALLRSIDERLTDADRSAIRRGVAELYDDRGRPA